jgi:hypothetical protein
VKIPLYKVIFVNKFSSGGGFFSRNTGTHLNSYFQNSCLDNLQKRDFSIKNTFNTQSHYKNKEDEKFLQWFVGFSDAESSLIIIPSLKKDKVTISSFSFMFKIALHKDDKGVLRYISSKLGIGKVRLYENECIFNVADKEGIKLLISIFYKYNFNTTKQLDYLDFKKAFHLYFNRDKELKAESVKDEILELKNKMNTNRVNFDRPENCKVIIMKSWLLGFIEGDGSFFVRRDTLTPVFCIELTGVLHYVLLKIKEFLEDSLGFDMYSLSTNTTPGLSLSKEQRDKLIFATPTFKYLYDGRVIDFSTGKLIHQQISCVYDIRKLNGEVLIENTLSKAASIVGVYPDTLSKYLDVKVQSPEKH